MPRRSAPLPPDRIYRTILQVLVASLLAGAMLALAGELVWHSPGLSQAGTWLVVATGGAYFFFRVLGAREARRLDAEEATDSEDGPEGRGGEP